MDEKRKEELISSAVNMEIEVTDPKHVNLQGYRKIPLTEVAGLGAAVTSLLPNFRTAKMSMTYSGKGFYCCHLKDGVAGTLAKAKDGSGYLGAVTNKGKIVGQARFEKANIHINETIKMPMNPYGIFISLALLDINDKINNIEKLGKDILNYQREKDQAEQQANFESLMDVYNKFKYNVKNEKWQMLKYADVQNIKRDTNAKMKLWKSQIQDHLNKCGSIHNRTQVQDIINQVQEDLQSYRLGVYMYALASFLETLLLGNFSKDYLQSVVQDIHDVNAKYQELNWECVYHLKKISSSSVESVALNGIAGLSHNVGAGIHHIPLINKSPVDKTLKGFGQDIRDFENRQVNDQLDEFYQMDSHASHFEEEIRQISDLYNSPVDLIMDDQNVYLKVE